MSEQPSYGKVLLTFARNSLIRDMTFRTNFVLDCVSSVAWSLMNIGFYLIVFTHVDSIGPEWGWGKYEFFVFLGTTWLINSLVQSFCMPNANEFILGLLQLVTMVIQVCHGKAMAPLQDSQRIAGVAI